jgi:hypothetical protein
MTVGMHTAAMAAIAAPTVAILRLRRPLGVPGAGIGSSLIG